MLMEKLTAHNYFYHNYIKNCICNIHTKEKRVLQGNAIPVAVNIFHSSYNLNCTKYEISKTKQDFWLNTGQTHQEKRNEIVINKRS